VDDTARIRRAANLLKARLTTNAQPLAILAAVGAVGTGVGLQFGLGYGLLAGGGLLFIDIRT
jgi:hypothetical protein